MFERIQRLVLRLLRVPAEPEPPFGDPASVRVFRASRRLYLLRLLRWGLGEGAALIGLLFWLGVVAVSEHEAGRLRAQGPRAGSLSSLSPGHNKVYVGPLRSVPPWVFGWLWVAKGVGLLIFTFQLLVTYAVVRLDYQMRWYIVTDRSLRIRWGLWQVQEITMSFANLQQVVVFQGPLERLLGLANVRVESAGGGGGSSEHGEGKTETMHSGIFHGVDNATQIRDLILERLRRFRESGLGDPDESRKVEPAPAAPVPSAGPSELLEAGRGLLSEARRLRAAIGPG